MGPHTGRVDRHLRWHRCHGQRGQALLPANRPTIDPNLARVGVCWSPALPMIAP